MLTVHLKGGTNKRVTLPELSCPEHELPNKQKKNRKYTYSICRIFVIYFNRTHNILYPLCP